METLVCGSENGVIRLIATRILLALNVLVMIALAIKNPAALWFPDKEILIDFGANYGILTCSGQQWRLLTSMFLHVGALHLIVNMYALYNVGPPAEQLFGWRNFVIIYLFSGLVGGLASCLWNPTLTSAGASGAIFGVYGSLLAFMYVQRDQYSKKMLHNHTLMAVVFLLCTVVCGWLMPEMDNFAHFGGLLAGAFSGFLFAHLQVSEGLRRAFILPVLALVTGGMMAITHVAFDRRGYNYYYQGLQAIKHRDFRMAVECFTICLGLQPNDAVACGSRGFAYMKLDELERAAADFARVVVLCPQSWKPYNDLAWVECGMKQYERALHHVNVAIRLKPSRPEASAACYDTRGYAESHLGMRMEAIADFDQAIKLAPNDPAPRYHRRRLVQIASSELPDKILDSTGTEKTYEPEHWED